jgi:hypothetical protein
VFERVGSQVRSPISRPQSDLCRLVCPGCPDPKARKSLNSHPPGYLDRPGNLAPSTYSYEFWGMGMPVGFCGVWSSGRGVTSSRCRPCPFFLPQTAQVSSQECPSHVLKLADFRSPSQSRHQPTSGDAFIDRTGSCRGRIVQFQAPWRLTATKCLLAASFLLTWRSSDGLGAFTDSSKTYSLLPFECVIGPKTACI